jgi:hypothetical protein
LAIDCLGDKNEMPRKSTPHAQLKLLENKNNPSQIQSGVRCFLSGGFWQQNQYDPTTVTFCKEKKEFPARFVGHAEIKSY